MYRIVSSKGSKIDDLSFQQFIAIFAYAETKFNDRIGDAAKILKKTIRNDPATNMVYDYMTATFKQKMSRNRSAEETVKTEMKTFQTLSNIRNDQEQQKADS